MDICRPFIERQIALAEPKAILLLGNFAARFFFGENDTIHGLRGRWKEIGARIDDDTGDRHASIRRIC